MKIKRVVSDRLLPDSASNRLQYSLNGVYVYVGYNARFINVGDGNNRIFKNESLIKLATTIGNESHGNIKVDMTDPDIVKFLKLTKCLN